MMSIKEIKALLDEGKIIVLYKDEDGYAVTEFPPSSKGAKAKTSGDGSQTAFSTTDFGKGKRRN